MESGERSRHLICDEDDETLLRELCVVNGVTYEKLALGCGAEVRRLDMFFFGCPRITGLNSFPNLRVLCIMNQRFGQISGLDCCQCLEELWICETQVDRIKGIGTCKQLTQLYLYSNQITLIEGLENLANLTKLWLNGNEIALIQGLENLVNLRDLNLSGNAIKSVDHGLDTLNHLEVLRLSGNQLTSLQDLVQLSLLPNLHSLSLCDPAYPPNPVCRLCNYTTHALYHLPHLHWLDDREVKGCQLQHIVQTIVANKKLYYRMRVHQALVACLHECRVLEVKKVSVCETKLAAIKMITRHIKSNHPGPGPILDSLSQRLSELTNYIKHVESCCRVACNVSIQWTQQLCQQWTSELESGGNIKFTPGDRSLSWYKSCCDLVNSRFSVPNNCDMGIGITGIKVRGITRVENRILYNRFNDNLRHVLEEHPMVSMTTSFQNKCLFDYLFLVWEPGQIYLDLCKVGLPSGGLISLSNSVNLADAPRLEEVSMTHFQAPGLKFAKLLSGKLLLCKVFIKQSREIEEDQMSMHSNKDYIIGGNLSSSQPRQWFVSDADFVLPEYIVNFSYLTKLESKDIFDIMLNELPPVMVKEEELAPPITSQPRLAMLDGSTVLHLTNEAHLTSVKELFLHNNHLSRFRLASSLPQLHKLVLSFNELTTAEDFCNMGGGCDQTKLTTYFKKEVPSLQILDLSFNKLTCLQGMRALPSLLQLHISWNSLKSYHDDVTVLQQECPALCTLDARNNAWYKSSYFRVHALGHLRSLIELNCVKVTSEEASEAARVMAATHLSLTTLLERAHEVKKPTPSLSLLPIAERLHHQPVYASHPAMSASTWASSVTTVALCNLGIRKLSCLDQLPNLKWLSLSDNAISSLEGLACCSKLEELTIDRNLLHSVDTIEHLTHLKWLSLLSNQLTSLPPLHALHQLAYLNISDNSIASLANLKCLSSLVELYASHNVLTDSRQLLCLKPLINLVVVDLSFNIVSSRADYRSFALYHLPCIKALDGCPVESNEIVTARDKFGGRLTQDMVSERYPDVQFSSLRTLDLLHCGLKSVDLSPVGAFDNLASLNLEHNSLSSFSGLVYLNRLKVLCLNHNRIECMYHDHTAQLPDDQVLKNLEVLHLAYNGIASLLPLQLKRIPSLRALFLQGNEITQVEGLETLKSLMELVLDRNKIKSLQSSSFSSQLNLRELHLEENRLKELSYLSSSLPNLEQLYLGMNRLQEFSELEKLDGLTKLVELSVVSNPVSRRLQHRSLLLFHLPSLLSLDGVRVTCDERHVAQMMFGSVNEVHELDDVGESSTGPGLPVGVGETTPLKVLTVPFAPYGQYHSQRKHMISEAPRQLRKGRRN